MLDIKNVIIQDHPFRLKLGRKREGTMQEILSMAKSYMVLEEKLNTWLNNLISVDPNLAARQERSSVARECRASTTNTRH